MSNRNMAESFAMSVVVHASAYRRIVKYTNNNIASTGMALVAFPQQLRRFV